MKQKQVRILILVLVLVFGLIMAGCSSGDATTTDPNQVSDVVWEWETLKVTTGFDNEA